MLAGGVLAGSGACAHVDVFDLRVRGHLASFGLRMAKDRAPS